MKSKTLLIAAAALAAGIMTSQAQVYSQNIVGYINIPVTASIQQFVCNQLDFDGTGTNNTIFTVFPNGSVKGTTIQCWNGAGFTSCAYGTHGWASTSNSVPVVAAMQPGSGFFINSSVTTNITLVGNVLLSNSIPLVAGIAAVVSPSIPIAGTIDTTNGYVPNKGDALQIWNGAGYNAYTYATTGGGQWKQGATVVPDPQLTVGEAVFITPSVSKSWTETLNVQ